MIVLWFRNGKLYKAHGCGARTWRRTANRWNERAKLWNKRFGYEKNLIGIIPDDAALELMQCHDGLPKHTPDDIRLRRKRIRELMQVAPWGKWNQ